MSAPPLVLASMSPRRRELLERLGLRFDVTPADVDEAALPGEDGPGHVERLALEKARAVAIRRPDALVIAGDTVVILDGQILAKPADEAEAVRMLLRLQGREHRVDTGVAVAAPGGRSASRVVSAAVLFRGFDEAVARAYVATGEPMDKAGSYGIQGYGSALVAEVRGDYYAVMGLPVAAVLELLEALGWAYRFPDLHPKEG